MDLITDLLITVLLYCTPAVFYRYAIIEAPIPEKKAVKFSILWSVIVYVALFVVYMAIQAGTIPNMAAAFIWGTVNTWILTRGSKKTDSSENTPAPVQQPAESQQPPSTPPSTITPQAEEIPSEGEDDRWIRVTNIILRTLLIAIAVFAAVSVIVGIILGISS